MPKAEMNPCSDDIYRRVKFPEPLYKNFFVSASAFHSALLTSGSLQSQISFPIAGPPYVWLCHFNLFASLCALLAVETMLLS